MSEQYLVDVRAVTGKAVRRLRREGTIPANIYGRGLDSVAVQLPWLRARQMLNAHGRNTLIEVQVASEERPRPVVIREIGRDPVSGAVEHIDFFQVDLARTIQADVSIHLVDEAPAVHTYGGILVQSLESLHIEALPNALPESIEVSVTGLTELDQSLTVADVVPPPGVSILTAPEVGLAQIARPRVVADADEELPEGEVPTETGTSDEPTEDAT